MGFPACISLHCKLVPVHYGEYAHGLFTCTWVAPLPPAECDVSTRKTLALGNSRTTENLGKDIVRSNVQPIQIVFWV